MVVVQALAYLRLTMLRNLVLGFLRPWWRPRSLIAVAVLVGYVAILLTMRDAPRRGMPGPGDMSLVMEFYLAVLLSMLLSVTWLFPGDRQGLLFTEAEAAFLFAAPISRRQLMHYKLVTGLLGGLGQAVMLSPLMVVPNPAGDIAMFCKVLLVFWGATTVYSFHAMAAHLVQQRLQHRGREAWLRHGVRVVVAAWVMVIVLLLVTGNFAPLQWLLPGRLLVHAGFTSGGDFVLWILLLWLVLALHYRWVLALETPFEESAMALAARHAAQMAGKGLREPHRVRLQREPFRLHAGLPIELVLLWKNLLKLPRYLNRHVVLGSLLVIVLAMTLLPGLGGDTGRYIALQLGAVMASCLAMVVGMAPMMAGLGLGLELARVDVIKAWPVPGWRIVLGNLLVPVLVATVMAWLLLLAIRLSPAWEDGFGRSPAEEAALMVGSVLLLPAILALEVTLGFVPQLCFPGWFKTEGSNKPGFDMLGVGMLFMLAVSVFIGLAALPPLLGVGVIVYLGPWLPSPTVMIVLATVIAWSILMLETLFIVHLLGERFEQLDIADELRQ